MAAKAIETLTDVAHELDVCQSAAVTVLDGLTVSARRRAESTDFAHTGYEGDADMPCVRFMTLAEAALLPAGSVDAVFVADVDVDNFPLSHEEGALATLAAKLGAAPMELEPAARLRDLFDRALDDYQQTAVHFIETRNMEEVTGRMDYSGCVLEPGEEAADRK